jgi:hypothetical protein
MWKYINSQKIINFVLHYIIMWKYINSTKYIYIYSIFILSLGSIYTDPT